ncbi:MAG: hypothetical protein A3K10_04465 [Bacteroidetes bacterium RIFCSPLOWO2_12_FULL_31_6]|nr:MAG: hypothetical protein A3K10_04465 [Bacteroidetes bacterium RIFCSPLOWO2_12_FULL_31_6]
MKAPGEDLNSILTGIMQPKGRIHMTVGKPIENELLEIEKISNENEKIKYLVNLIDTQLHSNYKLWPVNYIASDIANESTEFSSHYTEQEKESFVNYIKQKISKLTGDESSLFNLFINMYSNPVKTKMLSPISN